MIDGSGRLEKVAVDGADFAAVRRTTTHWYRFDPNRPTVDELRAIEANNKRGMYQSRKFGINDRIKVYFQKLVFW